MNTNDDLLFVFELKITPLFPIKNSLTVRTVLNSILFKQSFKLLREFY